MIRLTEKGKQLYEATKDLTPAQFNMIQEIAHDDTLTEEYFWNMFNIPVPKFIDLRKRGYIEGE